MEDDASINILSDGSTDDIELEDELLAAKPKGGSHVTDGTSNT
jgi:hypothetical protein